MRRAATVLLIALLALPLAACSKKPVSMQLQTMVNGRDVELRIQLQNFAMPGDGHIHLFLDTIPDPVMIQRTTYIFHNLRPGEHQIRVQLTDAAHNPLKDPGTDQTIPVTIA